MTLERLQRSDMQPIFGVARHRAYTPMSSIDPLQGACSPDVISTNMNLAGSSDGVAEGDPTTNLAMNLAFDSTYNIIKEKKPVSTLYKLYKYSYFLWSQTMQTMLKY